VRYLARIGEREIAVEVARRGGRYAIGVDGAARRVEARRAGRALLLTEGDRTLEAIVVGAMGGPAAYAVTIGGRLYEVQLEDPLRRPAPGAGVRNEGRGEVRSIMPGKVTALLVEVGQEVQRGQGLIVIEAMKMENEIPAPRDGRVTAIEVGPGETVEAGALLLTVE